VSTKHLEVEYLSHHVVVVVVTTTPLIPSSRCGRHFFVVAIQRTTIAHVCDAFREELVNIYAGG
jgi:hypothetical protein